MEPTVNTGQIHHKTDAQTPGLNCRCLWLGHAETGWQVELLYRAPPRIKVVNHELHHEICCPLLLEAVPENEAAGTYAKDRDVAVKQLFKSDRFIEAFAQSEIFRRQKWARESTA
jgi:hypothetical protein